MALNNPVDSAAAVKSVGGRLVNERTEYFAGGMYWVTRCDPDTGKPLESTIVDDVPVLGKTTRAALTVIEPMPGRGDDVYGGTTVTHAPAVPADGRDSARAIAARRKVAESAPPPTSEAKQRRAARPTAATVRRVNRAAVRKLLRRAPKAGRALLRARSSGTADFGYKCTNYQYILLGWRWGWIPAWAKSGYSFYKNPSGAPNWDSSLARLDNGHATWSQVSNLCGFAQITNYGDNAAGIVWDRAPVRGDGWNVVGWGNPAIFGGECTISALACANWVAAGGYASETDQIFNNSNSFIKWYNGTNMPPSTKYDLWGVSAHESGHSLGLAHSNTLPTFDNGQIMNWGLSTANNNWRYQGAGDWVGYHLLYGP